MVRYADKYDPDLGSAFEKLAASLPDPLRSTWGGASTSFRTRRSTQSSSTMSGS